MFAQDAPEGGWLLQDRSESGQVVGRLEKIATSPHGEWDKYGGRTKMRWIVGAGALLVAVIALYVLMNVRGDGGSEPVLDDIDAKARAEMRDLLREAE